MSFRRFIFLAHCRAGSFAEVLAFPRFESAERIAAVGMMVLRNRCGRAAGLPIVQIEVFEIGYPQ